MPATLNVRPVTYALGAEITGVDASKPLAEDVVQQIRQAWFEHLVLVFPNQRITMAQHIEFTRYFGELQLHPLMHARHSLHPEIFEITNRVVDGKPSETADIARRWHSDGAFTVRPPTGSLLHCRACPDVGGDTWFSNMYMAYDRLSGAMQKLVDQLEVVNDVRGADLLTRGRTAKKVGEELDANPPVVQPMVRIHKETGRKALYLNETVTQSIYGMTYEESEGLLKYLFRHSVRPEFTYRHAWRVHDIVMWDNRCAMHVAPKDYDSSQIRHMCRTTLMGDPSGRVLHPRETNPLSSASASRAGQARG
jgi:taurine dioxygenase